MNCREIQDLLTPYLLGDLEPAQAAEVRTHLQTCAICQASVEDLQATLLLMREGLADTSTVPSQLPEKFILQFKKRRWRRPRIVKPKPVPKLWWVSITEYAAVAAVLLILAGLMFPALSSTREKARRVNDLSNLNGIWKSASAWGLNPSTSFRSSFPASLDQLVKEAKISPKMLVNPETGKPVEYYPGADSSDGDRPILVSHGIKGRNVVTVSGTGKWVEDGTPQAEALTRQLAGLPKQVASASPMSVARKSVPAPEQYDFAGGVSAGKNMYASAAPARSRPADALELNVSESAERKDASAKPLEVAALSSIRRDTSRLTADMAGPPLSKQETKAETKEVKVGATVASAKNAVTRITVAAPTEFVRAETLNVTPALQMAEVKVTTDMSKKIESARIGRLREVAKFQMLPATSSSASPATNAVPAPEPAATNAPPVTVPVCRATGVNPFVSAAAKPFSTFSIDVDTASYTLSRNYLLRGQLPPPEAVRTEEFVNYFDYDYTPPNGPTFAVYTDCGPSAFGRGLSLLKIGVKGRRLGREEKRAAVLTLLIDTSGSMATPDRIELVKSALAEMVERLDPADKVAIVQYDSHARLLLEHTRASDKKRILAVIEGLQTSGSTALEEGMREAYATAARGFNSAGCNRVLLLSDGMANLGTTAAEDILKSVAGYRKQGITLSVFGFGLGAYNDVMLETLANKGDGVYAFIDSPAEAKRVLVDDLAATVNLIARDVKIQVEFNPKRVKQYRQFGYENRQLKKEEFRDDSVDAGEIGSGQSVTALYELELQGDSSEPLGMVRVRCRNALTGQIEEIEQPIMPAAGTTPFEAMDVRFRLAAAAAEFSEILRGSPFAAGSRLEDVARVLRPVALELSLDNRIQELLRMTQTGLTPKFQETENAYSISDL